MNCRRPARRFGVTVLSRLGIISRVREKGAPAVLGLAFVGVLALSLLLYLALGNGATSRILFFPVQKGRRLVAEQRYLPRKGGIEKDIVELVEGVLLGPTRHDAQRLFPHGGRVTAAMLGGRTLYLDLTPAILADDPEITLRGREALDALARTIRFNFPRVREVVFLVDGQSPRFAAAVR
jgi:hypothetical protein